MKRVVILSSGFRSGLQEDINNFIATLNKDDTLIDIKYDGGDNDTDCSALIIYDECMIKP